ncbi:MULTISPECIES: hypothetical protein [Streptomyces]|uniref:Uncharacterized protein n=1 Tax=Streptomyces misionensis TaxID=67331 RepID=A0A1H4TBT2_9ACTN|nr:MULTISPECIES: hypothetical protein [Streptomyces]SEC53926.1 hypothetical protein SAMN04490357_2249 [Streptomyces misionensis]SFY52564.1 hypothetical protein STEPF1_05837 [Streptomyces sp. F-1]
MSARTHHRTHPATTGGADIRLPWWALALPALAFVFLFLLILSPSDAHAAGSDPAIPRLVEHAQQLLGH